MVINQINWVILRPYKWQHVLLSPHNHEMKWWCCVIIINDRNTEKNTNVLDKIPNFEASFTIWTLLKSFILRSFKVCPSADVFFNPLPPDISIYILHTIYYTFHKMLTKRICLIIKSCFSWWSFPLFSWP